MDKKTAERLRNHEVEFYEANDVDPGPIENYETGLDWEPRYAALAEKVRQFFPPDKEDVYASYTPGLEILSAQENRPAVKLHFSVEWLEGEDLPGRINAVWYYDNAEKLRDHRRRYSRIFSSHIKTERFAVDWIKPQNYDPNEGAISLNNLEHSVAAYQEALDALAP